MIAILPKIYSFFERVWRFGFRWGWSYLRHKWSEGLEASSHTGKHLVIIEGTGKGQVRIIVGFDPKNKVHKITPQWEIPPDHTSQYTLLEDFPVDWETEMKILNEFPHRPL